MGMIDKERDTEYFNRIVLVESSLEEISTVEFNGYRELLSNGRADRANYLAQEQPTYI